MRLVARNWGIPRETQVVQSGSLGDVAQIALPAWPAGMGEGVR